MKDSNTTSTVLYALKFFIVDNWILAICFICVSIVVARINRKFNHFNCSLQEVNINPSSYQLLDFITKTLLDGCNTGWYAFTFGIMMLSIQDSQGASIDKVVTDNQALQIARGPDIFAAASLFTTIIIFAVQLQSFRAILRRLQAFRRELGD
jgi:hypothetical protein